MHPVRFRDRDYTLTVASDITLDSMLLELDDVTGGLRETVADVRYDDAHGTMSLSTYRDELPLEAVEHLIAAAKRRLPPVTSADGPS
jgi:hypothetical protein